MKQDYRGTFRYNILKSKTSMPSEDKIIKVIDQAVLSLPSLKYIWYHLFNKIWRTNKGLFVIYL